MFSADGLSANAPPAAPIAKETRSSREAMVAAAQSYFDGLERHDSSVVLGQKGCVRIENGVMTSRRGAGHDGVQPAARRKRGDGTLFPRNLLTELFVVENGRIHGIYAAMHYLIPDNPEAPGWQ